MRTRKHDTKPTRTDYVRRVAEAIGELDRQRIDAMEMPRRTDAEHAARAARLALVCARMAAWWGLLARDTYRDLHLHSLYGRAAVVAEHTERDRAGSGATPPRIGRPAPSTVRPPTPLARCRTGTSWG